MNGTTYHTLLRVSALTLALVLLFDSGLLSPVTKELSRSTQSYLASAVGATARVEPNEINTLTAQISARERELDAREAAINEREISVGLNTSGSTNSNDVSTFMLSILLFIILVLIVLNYVLDYIRARRPIVVQNG